MIIKEDACVGVFFLLYRKLLRNSYKAKKPSGGCALAREEIVAIATVLGASVLRAERFLVLKEFVTVPVPVYAKCPQ